MSNQKVLLEVPQYSVMNEIIADLVKRCPKWCEKFAEEITKATFAIEQKRIKMWRRVDGKYNVVSVIDRQGKRGGGPQYEVDPGNKWCTCGNFEVRSVGDQYYRCWHLLATYIFEQAQARGNQEGSHV